ncbi:MAG: cobalt ECF transporter T component CbiQ [Eubacteriaceae bacterium]|nr:cobalt ECF transporter T component CbiQ [Eubacteriaceae bacterium]
MINAALASLFIWLLYYGRLQSLLLGAISIAVGFTIAVLTRHSHNDSYLHIDIMAQISKLSSVNPALKLWSCLALMAICTASKSPAVGACLFIAMAFVSVGIGGQKARYYAKTLAFPVLFLLLSCLALLVEKSAMPLGVLCFKGFGSSYLVVTKSSQRTAELAAARALGSASCLITLAVSTSISDLISALKQAKCPSALIDLAYLIYRYIFVILSMFESMGSAARSRLGYKDMPTSIKTTGILYASLLARSYRNAEANFKAMESRCYSGGISFIESASEPKAQHSAFAAGLIVSLAALAVFLQQ